MTEVSEEIHRVPTVYDNATHKNKTLYTNYVGDKPNLSNKIRKIINKLEMEEKELEINSSYDLHSMRPFTLTTAVVCLVLNSVYNTLN